MKPTKQDIGKLVKYFKNGWRYGRLQKVTKKDAAIRPTVLSADVKKHLVHIPLEDVEVINDEK